MVRPILPKEERPSSPRTDESSKSAGKRRCISSACLPCRRRKSKCDGASPSCSTCAAVYRMECVYDQDSDRRRRSTLRRDMENLQAKKNSLESMIQQIRSAPDAHVASLVDHLRAHASLEDMPPLPPNPLGAQHPPGYAIKRKRTYTAPGDVPLPPDIGVYRVDADGRERSFAVSSDWGFVVAGTPGEVVRGAAGAAGRWTEVTANEEVVRALLDDYFTHHHPMFMFVSEIRFRRDYDEKRELYCSPGLVNAMCALAACYSKTLEKMVGAEEAETLTKRFWEEAKATVEKEEVDGGIPAAQALAIMSLQEMGTGRDRAGWLYAGRAIRIAMDMGAHLPPKDYGMDAFHKLDPVDMEVRQILFWGLNDLDKIWSMYLGRVPALPASITACPRPVLYREKPEPRNPYDDAMLIASHFHDLTEALDQVLYKQYAPTEKPSFGQISAAIDWLRMWKNNIPDLVNPRHNPVPAVLLLHMYYDVIALVTLRPLLTTITPQSPIAASVSRQAADSFSGLLAYYRTLPPTVLHSPLILPLLLPFGRYLLSTTPTQPDLTVCIDTLTNLPWPAGRTAASALRKDRKRRCAVYTAAQPLPQPPERPASPREPQPPEPARTADAALLSILPVETVNVQVRDLDVLPADPLSATIADSAVDGLLDIPVSLGAEWRALDGEMSKAGAWDAEAMDRELMEIGDGMGLLEELGV